MHWAELFAIHMPVLEIIIRGSAIYWFLFLIFRFVMRRDVGAVGIADILLLVIIADAAQNAMAGEYKSIGEGMILVTTIVGWNFLLDWLSYHSPVIDRFVKPRTSPLVRHGRPIKGNMAREFLTMDELQAKLRQQGIERLAEVKAAWLEPDGAISVIRYKKDQAGG
jgi:uncharacterized membrane protein YcaP (DUF421 family)